MMKKWVAMVAMVAGVAFQTQAGYVDWSFYQNDLNTLMNGQGFTGATKIYIALSDNQDLILEALSNGEFLTATQSDFATWNVLAENTLGNGTLITGVKTPYYYFGSFEMDDVFWGLPDRYSFFVFFVDEDKGYYNYSNSFAVQVLAGNNGANMVFGLNTGSYRVELSFENPMPIPEPSTTLLLVVGGAMLGLRRRFNAGGVK